jgi:hypothetical protein
MEVNILISAKCTVCGREFSVEFEIKGEGQHIMLPGNIPLRVRHCAGGNFVDVPGGKLTAFYEMVDGKPVEAEPVLSDALED